MHDAWSLPRLRTGRRIAAASFGALAAALCAVGCFGLAAPTLAPDPNAPNTDGNIGAPDGQTDPTRAPAPAPQQPPPVTPVGAVDASFADTSVANDSSADASSADSSDASTNPCTPSPPVLGVRCGGGTVPATQCTGATPACCATTAVSGAFNYTCAPADSCGGVSIQCADGADCQCGQICCFGATLQACTPQGTCPPGHQVCDPNSATSCPAGTACQQLVFNGFLVPYFSCQ